MNTPAPTQRIQTTYAIGLALLISGATSASQRAESLDGPVQRQGYETYSKNSAGCAANQHPRLIFSHGVRQPSASCTSSAPSPAARMARPLSGPSYNPTSESIRYSF